MHRLRWLGEQGFFPYLPTQLIRMTQRHTPAPQASPPEGPERGGLDRCGAGDKVG